MNKLSVYFFNKKTT